jgi:hypothetical protein
MMMVRIFFKMAAKVRWPWLVFLNGFIKMTIHYICRRSVFGCLGVGVFF